MNIIERLSLLFSTGASIDMATEAILGEKISSIRKWANEQQSYNDMDDE